MAPESQTPRPTGGSRARDGGSAQPLDDTTARATGRRTPVPAATPRAAPARRPGPAAPGTNPPSIHPAGRAARPANADGAIPVGRPNRPSAPTPYVPRATGGPRAATSGRPPATAPSARPSLAPRPSTPRPSLTPPTSRTSPTPLEPGTRRRRIAIGTAAVLVLLLAWPIGLTIWANGKIQHVPALSGAVDTPGTTYLLAGSDSREDESEGGIGADGTEGGRTDTIMLLQVPPSGPAALISLPRDTYADIPGQGFNKLNAAYAWGGAPLLVATVEGLSGMHVDHFVEIGLGGVARVVDAVGGVELCLDPAVNLVDFPLNDVDSGLVWDAPGCRVAAGADALAFARMRKADKEGDIGRAKRQQQLIAALTSSIATPSLVVNPRKQVALIGTGLGALEVSEGSNILDLGRLALAFRSATGPDGIKGTPPIRSLDYRPGGVGSTVQLDPDLTPAFFEEIMNGTLPAGPVGGAPTG